MDSIRVAALAAVAEVGPAWNGGAKVAQAMKLVRDRTGCPLAAARDAVEWAIDRPAAATLPFGTVMAGKFAAVWVKEEESSRAARPWTATHIGGPISDAAVDKALREGDATILRVGTGES